MAEKQRILCQHLTSQLWVIQHPTVLQSPMHIPWQYVMWSFSAFQSCMRDNLPLISTL